MLLASIDTAQWMVLRHLLPSSAMWIPANAVAWLLGLGAFLAVSTPLWHPGQPFAVVVAIGLPAGLVMARGGRRGHPAVLLELLRHSHVLVGTS